MLNQDLRIKVKGWGRFFQQLRKKLVGGMTLISFIIFGVIFPLIAIVFRFPIIWMKLMRGLVLGHASIIQITIRLYLGMGKLQSMRE